jgi:hypothetical protein
MAAQVFRVTYSGTLPGAEIFSYGHWVGTGEGGGATAAAVAYDSASAVSAFLTTTVTGVTGITTLTAAFASDVVWTQSAVREYNPTTGAPIGAGAVLTALSSLAGSGGAGTSLPNQVSLSVTIDRGGIGRERWNRFYLPPMVYGQTMADGSQAKSGLTTAVGGGVLAMSHAYTHGTSGVFLAHWSGTGKVLTPGPSVKVGNIWDTERRRRNHLVETYYNAGTVPTS